MASASICYFFAPIYNRNLLAKNLINLNVKKNVDFIFSTISPTSKVIKIKFNCSFFWFYSKRGFIHTPLRSVIWIGICEIKSTGLFTFELTRIKEREKKLHVYRFRVITKRGLNWLRTLSKVYFLGKFLNKMRIF